MKNLALVAAAAAALWSGTAFAQDNVADRPAPAREQAGQQLAYATTTRGQVSIYPNFRNDGYSQGGEQ